jgi:hypothetical protein
MIISWNSHVNILSYLQNTCVHCVCVRLCNHVVNRTVANRIVANWIFCFLKVYLRTMLTLWALTTNPVFHKTRDQWANENNVTWPTTVSRQNKGWTDDNLYNRYIVVEWPAYPLYRTRLLVWFTSGVQTRVHNRAPSTSVVTEPWLNNKWPAYRTWPAHICYSFPRIQFSLTRLRRNNNAAELDWLAYLLTDWSINSLTDWCIY